MQFLFVRIFELGSYFKKIKNMQFRINKVQFIYQDEELYINGKLIECPQKILQALILFVTSKNEIISKDTLLYKLWGELIVSEDSLFKVVQGVRKIFKENGVEGEVLINVYGKGYKINPKIKKAFFQIPTKEIPIIVLQNKINHKRFKRSMILAIGVL
ncbi:MAG: winged helix-turn-helix domain-containing protein, partial [Xanthomonadales bacterium]|nr:winged helix-turn-helix domain-containing protein [Xanthomonadales bacterium]